MLCAELTGRLGKGTVPHPSEWHHAGVVEDPPLPQDGEGPQGVRPDRPLGSPIANGFHARRCRNSVQGAGQILLELFRGHLENPAVQMSMDRHFVPFASDGPNQGGFSLGDVPEGKERGVGVPLRSSERIPSVLRVTRLS